MNAKAAADGCIERLARNETSCADNDKDVDPAEMTGAKSSVGLPAIVLLASGPNPSNSTYAVIRARFTVIVPLSTVEMMPLDEVNCASW